MARITGGRSEETALSRAHVEDAVDAVWNAVEAGGDIYDIPATKRHLLRRHDPKTLDDVAEVAAKRRRGEDIETNADTFQRLVWTAGLHPKVFIEQKLRKHRARLSAEDYAFLKDLQDQLRSGGNTAKHTGAFLRTMVRKANTADLHISENGPETFHRFVTTVHDLQRLEDRQFTEAEMNKVLVDIKSEDKGTVYASKSPENKPVVVGRVIAPEQRVISNSQASLDVSHIQAAGERPDVRKESLGDGEATDIGDVETFLNSPFTGLLRGIVKFGGNVLGTLGVLDQNEVDDFNHMLDALNEIAVENNPAARIGGATGEIAGQFIIPAAGIYKTAIALGASPLLASVLSEAGVGFAGVSPNDGNLLNLVAEDSEAFSAVRDLLATDPDSSNWINRTRNAAVALATLGAGEAAIRSLIRGIEQSKRFVKSGIVQRTFKVIDETDVRLKGDEEAGAAGLDEGLDQPYGIPVASRDLSGSGEVKTSVEVSKPKDRIHKNSHAYVGETHEYIIRAPDGTLYKIGESAQGTRVKDGASIRAEQQVRQLYREVGPGFTSIILKNFPDKRTAYTYQINLIKRYRRMYGSNTLPGNKTNR